MIDLNRGVTMRTHPQGFYVCMYKDSPGVYLDVNGREVGEQMAKDSGFPVKDFARERLRRLKLETAMAEINAEFGKLPEGEVVFEKHGFRVVHGEAGAFFIEDPDGNRMSEKGSSKPDAIALAEQLASVEANEPIPEDEDGSQA
jgi:hypothetical protein